MAHKLYLLASPYICPIFHVFCLKKVVGPNYHVHYTLRELDEEGSIWIHPTTILQTREPKLI